MNINSIELIILQLVLDVILIILFILVYIRLKSIKSKKIEAFLNALRESEELTKRLNKLIEEKKFLVNELEGILTQEKRSKKSEKLNVNIQADQLLRSKVISLWKKGKNNKEISKETGLSLGEIELIIALFKSKQIKAT